MRAKERSELSKCGDIFQRPARRVHFQVDHAEAAARVADGT